MSLFLFHYTKAQSPDSAMCDKHFRDLASWSATYELPPKLWSSSSLPNENSDPVLCELCELFFKSSKEFILATFIIDKTGNPICVKISPESINDSLKNEIEKLLYQIEFTPAIGNQGLPVMSHFGLVINSKKCEIYKNLNREKKRKKKK